MKILQKLTKLYKEELNLRLELDVNSQGLPVARLFKPTPRAKYQKEKMLFGFYFQTEDERLEHLNSDYKKRDVHKVDNENSKFIQQEKRRYEALNVKVGDIFKDSWGYEQTNVDYYQVIEKPSACFVVVKEICYETIENISSMSSYIKPCKNKFKNEKTRKVKLNGNSFKPNSFSYAYKVQDLENEKAYCSWYY